MTHQNKPRFEMIFGVYVIAPGYAGVKRRFGKITEAIAPSYTFGIPFVHDIAAIPQTPGIINELEHLVRSSDNREIQLVSDTTIIIHDPIAFMRRSPEDYLDKLIPNVQQSVQQNFSGYVAREFLEKNEELSEKVKLQLNEALTILNWGMVCTLFRYIANTDAADLLQGDAQKLRGAELSDATARRKIAVVEADAEAQVGFIVRRYEINAEVYRLRNEGFALADVQQEVGLAEMAVLQKRLDIYAGYIGNLIDKIGAAREKLTPNDAEILIAYTFAPLESMLSGTESSGSSGQVKKAIVDRITQRLEGQGKGRYIEGTSAAGVNPNVSLAGNILSALAGRWKSK